MGAASTKKKDKEDHTLSEDRLPAFGADTNAREFIAALYAAVARLQSLRRRIAGALHLNPAEFSVLLAVWHMNRSGSPSIRAIADHLHVAGAHVTVEVGRLVRAGYLAKVPSASDQRTLEVALTDKGQELMSRVLPLLRSVNDVLFSNMSQSQISSAYDFMVSLIGQSDNAIHVVTKHSPSADVVLCADENMTRSKRLIP